jgi:pyrroline-5-carboxylate reductase
MAEQDSPTGDLEQLVAAAVQAGLPEDEARRTVASAARKAAAR